MADPILAGQVALVTGAGRGYGREIALRLAAAGAKLGLVARSLSQLEAVAGEIRHNGGEAACLEADVTSSAALQNSVAALRAQLGPIDILVSNAGVPGPFGPIWETDPEAWWASQHVHVRAPATLLHAVLPDMIARGRGCCVLISALASRMTIPYMSAYSTGKAAQNKLIESVAAELGQNGVAAFAVDPGFTVTQMAKDSYADPSVRKWLPTMITHLEAGMQRDEGDADLKRTADRVVKLASGQHNALSGRYLTLDDDLELLGRASAST